MNCTFKRSKVSAVPLYHAPHAQLQDCHILQSLRLGVNAEGDTCKFDIAGGNVSECGFKGFIVHNGASGRVSNVTGSECPNGIVATPKAHVEVHECLVKACGGAAITSTESGIVVVSNSMTVQTQGAGYGAQCDAQLIVKDCVNRGDNIGCCSLQRGRIVCERMDILSSQSQGIDASKSSSIECKECKVMKCSGQQVAATTGSMSACTVEQSRQVGIYASQGGQVDLQNVSVNHSSEGSGICANQKGSHVSLQDCSLEDNAGYGVAAHDEGCIELTNTQCDRNKLGDTYSVEGGCVIQATSGG